MILYFLSAIAAGQPSGLAAAAAPARTSQELQQLTPTLAQVFSTPRWFLGDDGQVHVVYEILLTNPLQIPVTVTCLDVVDDATGKTVRTLAGTDLLASTSLLAVGDVPTTKLGPSEIGALWLDLAFADRSSIPSSISHRLTVGVPPGLPILESVTTTIASVQVAMEPPAVLVPPLAGDQWVAVGSCCDGPHRRAFQPINGELYLSQRFAIDFNRLDTANRFSNGDPEQLASYPTFGLPVLAVADGRVVAAVDVYPDQVPRKTEGITLENADGNHVILDIGNGRFAFYAHLKPRSVQVRKGDQVTSGQKIGEAGNSGSSDGPHLHFHVMNGPEVLASDGMPYVFNNYWQRGRIPPLDQAAKYYEAQKPVPIGNSGRGKHHNELPLSGAVVTFPDYSQR